jgi:ABC-type transport system substrate-binding protein
VEVDQPAGGEAATIFQHDVAFARLRHAVLELQSAVKQLEVGLRGIQEGQDQHQQGLKQTLSTVEELSAATQEVAASAQMSASAARSADELAGQGREAVTQAHAQMGRIKDTVRETGETVVELGQRTAAITKIVDVIQRIADQTNLLSLNASIEAAHAGEAGRGFAVVAGEVRKLSEQSAAQARQIAGVVNEIQKEIKLVTARMSDSLAAVDAGSAVVNQAGQALEAIVDAAGQVNEMVGQISAAATQQADGSRQIVEVSSSMSELAEQVSFSIDKAMMDAGQQQAALERLIALTGHLGDISVNLAGRSSADRPVQRYSWCIGSEPITFDPQLSNDMTTTYVIAEVFMGLTRFGPDTRIVPGLAKAWDLSPDGRTWTFQLRKGATFHNGREVTANDVKYSLERILRPETHSPNTWLVEMIKGAAAVISGRVSHVDGIETDGDYTVRITLEKPYHPFLANLAYVGTSIVPKEVAEKGELASNPIGAGPFRFVEYKQGDRVLLKAHEEFFGGRPFLDEVELLIRVQGKTELEAFLADEIDHMNLGAQNLRTLQDNPRYAAQIQRMSVIRANYMGLNCGKGGPLSNPLVRQALNLAVDKDAIISEIYGGLARVASGPLPPGCDGFDEALEPYPFNLAAAKARLKEAGYPHGLPEPLIIHIREGNATQRQEVEMLQGWFGQIGVKLEARELPWNELTTTAAMQKCDMFLMAWIGDTGDPDNFLQPLFNSENQGDRGNRCFFASDEVDALLAEGQTVRDPDRRRQLYQRLQRLLHDQAPWVFLCYNDQFAVTQPYVRGYGLHPLGMVYLENVWLDGRKSGLEEQSAN